MASEPGEAKAAESPSPYYVRQIFCDVVDPKRGVIVTGGDRDNTLQIMVDGNAVTVDRKMFATAVGAYA